LIQGKNPDKRPIWAAAEKREIRSASESTSWDKAALITLALRGGSDRVFPQPVKTPSLSDRGVVDIASYLLKWDAEKQRQ
jgi:hypothetical protein